MSRPALAPALGLAACVALASCLALASIAPPSASAHHTLSLSADSADLGYIGLRLHASPGVEAVIRDEASGRERRLVPDGADTRLRRFARWSCSSRSRAFLVTQIGGDGLSRTAQASVTTPSCSRRLALAAPGAVHAGRPVAAVVRDRWRLGTVARFCVDAPGAAPHCRRIRIASGARPRPVPVRALRPGGYRLSLQTEYVTLRRTLRARPRGGRLRVLATGDSMIQIVDSFLAARLGAGGGARVRSDARVSTGISKPSLLDWRGHARRQASARPDVVVMFIGANDGFPMAGVACCGPAWVAEYARRARSMMRTYARGGRARVVWLLLPDAREEPFRSLFPSVNRGLRRAARGLDDDVRLIDLAEVFTPGGRFRETMEVGGRAVKVRNGDGVHLSSAGASLVANLVIRTLRRERVLVG